MIWILYLLTLKAVAFNFILVGNGSGGKDIFNLSDEDEFIDYVDSVQCCMWSRPFCISSPPQVRALIGGKIDDDDIFNKEEKWEWVGHNSHSRHKYIAPLFTMIFLLGSGTFWIARTGKLS